MRHLIGPIVTCLAFIAGTGSAWSVERLLVRSFPLAEGVAVHETVVTDDVRDLVLADHIDLRVNGVRIGTTEKEMLRLLGKPVRVENFDHMDGDPYFREYTYSGLTVGVIGWQGKWTVDSLSVESGPWNANGLSLGASVADVKRTFGQPAFEDDNTLVYPDISGMDATFTIDQGRLTEVFIGGDDC